MALISSTSNKKAFTLVELSIVIVIIALIIAGVAAGSSLVKQFKLRTIIADKNMYFTAMRAFELQYGGMAGDLKNASLYWGASNGNGDGKIIGIDEGVYAWNHLQLANLISNGSYNGIYAINEVPGVNIGYSRYSNIVGFHIFTFTFIGNQWGYGTSPVYGKYNTALGVGKIVNGTVHIAANSSFSPVEALSLDKKIDDGKPGAGILLADNGFDTGVSSCRNGGASVASAVTASNAPTLTYLTTNTVGCRLMFIYK